MFLFLGSEYLLSLVVLECLAYKALSVVNPSKLKLAKQKACH